MTKQIRISDKVHLKLKVHVAKSKESIVKFADKAIKDAIELARVQAKNQKSMKATLVAGFMLLSTLSFSQISHTFYKVDYHDEGNTGFTKFKSAPPKTMNSYNLMLYSGHKQVLTYECSGKVNVYDTATSIHALLNMAGTLYDQKQELQDQNNILYSLVSLVKEGHVTDKEKWNKLIADFVKK
jgi:hypothetical protein